MTKTSITVTIDVQVKERAVEILDEKKVSLSKTINDLLADMIEKEDKK